MTELTPHDVALFTETNFATFVTMNPDGSPHATIIWVDAADGLVLVNTAKHRVKDRNVRANPHVAVCVLRDGDAYDWTSITGTVVGIEEGDRAERHIDELSHRYDGHGYRFTPGQVREILTIRPDRIVRYGTASSSEAVSPGEASPAKSPQKKD